jgi:elongation factor P--beta-lysine ligase
MTYGGFFSARAVLEVETPLLSYSSGTDPQLDFFYDRLLFAAPTAYLVSANIARVCHETAAGCW